MFMIPRVRRVPVGAKRVGTRMSWCAALLGAVLTVSAVAPAAARTDPDPPGRRMRLPAPPTDDFAARGIRAAPAITIGIPSGYGADWGDGAVGIGFQATTRLRDRPDGVVGLAFGLGSARELVGLEVVATSYGTVRSCCRGGLSFKVHRVLPAEFGVALGWENGVLWGSFTPSPSMTDAGRSVYGAVSKVVYVRRGYADAYRTLTLTLGAGNGRFRSEEDIINDREAVNLFGGAALRMSRGTSIVVDWTGQDVIAGFSMLPVHDRPFVVMPGVADITTNARFVLGAAYGFDYTSIFR
jgi:hypothetical protein